MAGGASKRGGPAYGWRRLGGVAGASDINSPTVHRKAMAMLHRVKNVAFWRPFSILLSVAGGISARVARPLPLSLASFRLSRMRVPSVRSR